MELNCSCLLPVAVIKYCDQGSLEREELSQLTFPTLQVVKAKQDSRREELWVD